MYYDHATLMALQLDRWEDERFLTHHHQPSRAASAPPSKATDPARRAPWLVEALRWLSRPRHLRT